LLHHCSSTGASLTVDLNAVSASVERMSLETLETFHLTDKISVFSFAFLSRLNFNCFLSENFYY
jgi:hypothetical protein